MITYRSHVYDLVMGVCAEAIAFSSELSDCLSRRNAPHYPEDLVGELPNLQWRASSVRSALEKLMAALPPEVNYKMESDDEGLLRHLHFMDYWLDQGRPGACSGDPIDIVSRDIPLVLNWFDKWYNQLSPVDSGLYARLAPLISNGQLNSALREAWAIFKTKMVTLFALSDNLDGHPLADTLFGSKGATASLLPENERTAYLGLFKGLYTLYRNPVSHNDVPSNPSEVDAVLALVNSALLKIESLQKPATPHP